MKKTEIKNGASVSVVDRTGRTGGRYLKLMELCARKAAGLLLLKGELSVAVVDDKEMRELNRVYGKIARTTDVLSFEQNGEGLIGDVVISFETARRRAAIYGVTLPEEIKRLVVHGVCHLAGHTHKKKKEGERMRAEESRILGAVSGF